MKWQFDYYSSSFTLAIPLHVYSSCPPYQHHTSSSSFLFSTPFLHFGGAIRFVPHGIEELGRWALLPLSCSSGSVIWMTTSPGRSMWRTFFHRNRQKGGTQRAKRDGPYGFSSFFFCATREKETSRRLKSARNVADRSIHTQHSFSADDSTGRKKRRENEKEKK